MVSEKRRVAAVLLVSAAALVPVVLYQLYVSEPIGAVELAENMTHAEKVQLEEDTRETVMNAVFLTVGVIAVLTAFSWWFKRRKERDGL